MLYPVVTLNSLQNFLLEAEVEGLHIDPPTPVLRGSGEDFFAKYKKSLYELGKKLEQSTTRVKSKIDPDEVEGKLSAEVFQLFSKLPTEVLTDKDFWRFLSSSVFLSFIVWRDGFDGALPSRASFGASSRSITMDCVPFRMFNRGLINYELTGSYQDDSYAAIAGTDIWRSHILRVKTSLSVSVTRGILEKLESGNLPTGLIRPLAKRLKRIRSNVIFEVLDSDDGMELFDSEYILQKSQRESREGS